jgi:taurine dioxygenase
VTTTGSARLTVEAVAGALGATVTGLDLTAVSEPSQLDGLRHALADHLVVFLPDQRLDLDGLERVTDLLGGRDVTPFVDPLEDRPYVIRVIKEPTDVLNFANAWHSDLSYLPEPPAYTLLHAWQVPSHGGDTLWSNQYLAYETLSPGLRATLDRLEAVHSAGLAYGTGGLLDKVKDWTSMAIAPSPEAYAEHVHPAVAVHPVTGRRALFVNPIYTVRFKGWTKEESLPLLEHLYRTSVNENFTCRLRWSVHMLTIWDNRCTMHNALNDYSGVRREMYRTSVKGSTPRGPERVAAGSRDANRRGRDASGSEGERPAPR